jgi:hypothetical protein
MFDLTSQDGELDEYGRTVLNTQTFPNGIHHLQSYLAQRNLKLGLYYLPGIDSRAVENQVKTSFCSFLWKGEGKMKW